MSPTMELVKTLHQNLSKPHLVDLRDMSTATPSLRNLMPQSRIGIRLLGSRDPIVKGLTLSSSAASRIVRNSDNETISILVINVDPAVNPAPLPDGSQSPAFISRSYSVAAQQIFGNSDTAGGWILRSPFRCL